MNRFQCKTCVLLVILSLRCNKRNYGVIKRSTSACKSVIKTKRSTSGITVRCNKRVSVVRMFFGHTYSHAKHSEFESELCHL